MEGGLERECSALGGLFQQIVNDMKNGSAIWEDFLSKATKLHTCLRTTLQAVASFLDAFQKIADAATNTRGATKDIGTTLTRICLRQKAVESRMKTFTSAIMDCMVLPLQDKLEEWKKTVLALDKDHTKEYKKARSELKKKSTDTLRIQKKVRKGGSAVTSGGAELHRMLEGCMQEMGGRYLQLEETEKQFVRAALLEERSRFCLFAQCICPVIHEEVNMMSELLHIQEVIEQLERHTSDPYILPPSSEQVILDVKGTQDPPWAFQTPPSSPGSSSIGSRKSSVCSISSLNSSSSGSTKSHTHSPSHQFYLRSGVSQPLSRPTVGTLRLSSISSQDSGFRSQDALFLRPSTPPSNHANADHLRRQISNLSDHSSGGASNHSGSSNSSTPSSPFPSGNNVPPNVTATWPNLQQTLQFERAASAIMGERPHTISTAYERGHQRPALTSSTFQPLEGGNGDEVDSNDQTELQKTHSSTSQPVSPVTKATEDNNKGENNIYGDNKHIQHQSIPDHLMNNRSTTTLPKPNVVEAARPPVPKRCSSLERPSVPVKSVVTKAMSKSETSRSRISSIPHSIMTSSVGNVRGVLPDFNQSAPDMIVPQPVYVNMNDLATMAAAKGTRPADGIGGDFPPPPPPEYTIGGVKGNGIVKDQERPVTKSTNNDSEEDDFLCGIPPPLIYNGTDVFQNGYYDSTSTQRPYSVAGYPPQAPCGTLRRTVSHSQPSKPPPPLRRTSSITPSLCGSQSEMSLQTESEASTPRGSLENLPPPPAFLLNCSTSQDGLSSTSSTGSLTSVVGAPLIRERSVSVADAVRSLTESRHQPASPGSVRRTNSLKLGEDQSMFPKQKDSESGGRASLIQALNARFGRNQQSQSPPASSSANASPRQHIRRFSEELHCPGTALSLPRQHVTNRDAFAPKPQPVTTTDPAFLQNLSAKIALMHHQHSPGSPGSPKLKHIKQQQQQQVSPKPTKPHHTQPDAAQRVRQWITNRTTPDPAHGRESLMDQIRRGTSLKKTNSMTSDRSAPSIH